MARCVIAGVAYFLIVFLLGFGLGTIRVLLMAPQLPLDLNPCGVGSTGTAIFLAATPA
jgi:hypothetical protein